MALVLAATALPLAASAETLTWKGASGERPEKKNWGRKGYPKEKTARERFCRRFTDIGFTDGRTVTCS